MAKLDSRGLRFRGWIMYPFSTPWPMIKTFYVYETRDCAIQNALASFPSEDEFYVQEVNFFEAHMEVDLGSASIVSKIYTNRYFKFDCYNRRSV